MEEGKRKETGDSRDVTIRIVVDQSPPPRPPKPPESKVLKAYRQGINTMVVIVLATLAARMMIDWLLMRLAP
jgi:hypothetical protein